MKKKLLHWRSWERDVVAWQSNLLASVDESPYYAQALCNELAYFVEAGSVWTDGQPVVETDPDLVIDDYVMFKLYVLIVSLSKQNIKLLDLGAMSPTPLTDVLLNADTSTVRRHSKPAKTSSVTASSKQSAQPVTPLIDTVDADGNKLVMRAEQVMKKPSPAPSTPFSLLRKVLLFFSKKR